MRPLAYHTDVAAALLKPVTCPSMNPNEERFTLPLLIVRDDAFCGEFELPTAGDVAWLLFSYT